MAAAVPGIIQGGMALGSALFGRKSAQGATQRSPEETAALTAQTGAANAQTDLARQQTAQGGQLFRQGMPQVQQAGRYFSTLAGGNRGAMTQALSPEISSINDVYGGTARTLSRFLRGPEKDVQGAEAERERAGLIGKLFAGGRGPANAQLGAMGAGQIGAGQAGLASAASANASAGGMFGQQVASGQANRYAGANLERDTGADFGGLMFQLLKGYASKGKSGTGGFFPTGGGGGFTAPSDSAGWG